MQININEYEYKFINKRTLLYNYKWNAVQLPEYVKKKYIFKYVYQLMNKKLGHKVYRIQQWSVYSTCLEKTNKLIHAFKIIWLSYSVFVILVKKFIFTFVKRRKKFNLTET